MNSFKTETLGLLRQRIREIETGSRPNARRPIPTGVGALDELLPGAGLRCGSLVELILTADGAGAWTLGLVMAWRVCSDRQMLVVIDECEGRGRFYPLAAARLGIDLHHCLVIRPQNRHETFAAMRESLRCAGVGAVIGWAHRLQTTEARQLELAARHGGAIGFLVRPPSAARSLARASLRLRVAPIQSVRAVRHLRVEVLRCRGRDCGQAITLEIHHGTGSVCVPARVAASAAPMLPPRATG